MANLNLNNICSKNKILHGHNKKKPIELIIELYILSVHDKSYFHHT